MCNQPLCVKFGGHNCCGGGDITYLICQATFQDHVIKGSCEFIEQSSLYVTVLSGLVAIDIVIDEICF